MQAQIVVTIHGIQTAGRWQKEITPHLAREGLIPYHIDYGWFDVLSFLIKWTRNRKIAAVRNELRTLVATSGARRVSVVAHSFGTFIAMHALLRENGNLLYDRVVLTGCILPTSFDWSDLLYQKEWVRAVRNERARDDWPVWMAKIASGPWFRWLTRLDAGDSGAVAFTAQMPELIDSWIDGGHSETHNVTQFMKWARFLAYPRLSGDTLGRIRTELQHLRQNAAAILNFPADNVRVNLFVPIAGKLRIMPGAHDNMTFAPEFDLAIEKGHGGTGMAFQNNSPYVLVGSGQQWTHNLPGDELEKINPRLRWVISMPVKSTTRNIMIGVVNVDGLDAVPDALNDVLSEECQAAVLGLQGVALTKVAPYMEKAFRGELIDVVEA